MDDVDQFFCVDTEDDESNFDPECRLVLAILTQSIEDAVKPDPSGSNRQRLTNTIRHRLSGASFLFSDELSDDPQKVSARWCAAITGQDLGQIRRGLRNDRERVHHIMRTHRKNRAA